MATPDGGPAPGGTTGSGLPAWVAATVGSVADAAPIRWGFTNESWAITAPDGRRLVVTRYADPLAAGLLLDRMPTLGARLTDVGIVSPIPIAELSDRGRSVVASQFVDGASAMGLMTDDAGAGLVGRVAGGAWVALGGIHASALDLDDLWARPSDLTLAALTWLERVSRSLPPRATPDVRARIVELPSLLAGRATGFVHGDLVPANLLIAEGGLAAVLDFEAVRIGERLLDPAWFRWIIRYHHPAIEPAAWAGFLERTQLDTDDEVVPSLLDLLPVVRILEILADPALGSAARGRWMKQLAAGVEALSA